MARSSTIDADPCVTLGTSTVRMKLSLQLLKRQAMGAAHDPGELQLGGLLTKLNESGVDVDASLSEQTLKNWWDGRVHQPKKSTSRYLDQVAGLVIKFPHHADGSWRPPAVGYFQSLQTGGLLRHLWKRAAKVPNHVALLGAAFEYQPASPWHIHLDALEAAALDTGRGHVSWQLIKSVAALRVLACVHQRWAVGGTAYAEVSSNQRLRGEGGLQTLQAPQTPGQALLHRHAQHQLNGGATPDWPRIPVDVDELPADALRTLVSLAGDTDFWVEDRLDAWSLDLASANLATRALLWSDRYASFWGRPGRTVALWVALARWFRFPFEDPTVLPEDPAFDQACDCCGLPAEGGSADVLRRAWKAYEAQLQALGLSLDELSAIALRCEISHPLQVKGRGSAPDLKARLPGV